ncbi:predicted protein [Arabidopsis lyrata subsp. lyrata]|uniref:Predicted protein n=1 Tax=Arabidopsis lyrata subsp. lyrata TaxID=81972 RepID=D7MBD6_ARALL|nr:predicted protein [Arabidopsis lyrata subsp. lyrata]
MASQSLMNCRTSSSSLALRTRVPKDIGEATIDPEPGDLTTSRRFLHKISMNGIDMTSKSLMQKLREMDVNKDRIRLDGLPSKTRSASKDLHSRIRVAIQSVDSISKLVERFRDDELEPQLLEFLSSKVQIG